MKKQSEKDCFIDHTFFCSGLWQRRKPRRSDVREVRHPYPGCYGEGHPQGKCTQDPGKLIDRQLQLRRKIVQK